MQLRLVPPAKITGSASFEKAWLAYPRRDTTEPKRRALRVWNNAVKRNKREHGQPLEEEMIASAEAYRDYCRRRGIEGTHKVKHFATFYGPDEWWRETFTVLREHQQPAENPRRWKPPTGERADVPAGFLTGLLRSELRR